MSDDKRDPSTCAPKPPSGFRFDAFADVRMGLSIFQMRDEDWLVRDDVSALTVTSKEGV